MTKNIFVSGANGFIGNSLINKLLSTTNYNVFGIYRKEPNKNFVHPRFNKISNFDLSEKKFDKLKDFNIDFFFHCAANSNYLEKNKELFQRDNRCSYEESL